MEMKFNFDSNHGSNPYESYLWIDENGTVMEMPIIYPNDKLTIGGRSFLGLFYDYELYNISLGGSYKAQEIYRDLLSDYIGGVRSEHY